MNNICISNEKDFKVLSLSSKYCPGILILKNYCTTSGKYVEVVSISETADANTISTF